MTTHSDRDPRLLLSLPAVVFDQMLDILVGPATRESLSISENVTAIATTVQTLMSTSKVLTQPCQRILYTVKAIRLMLACGNELSLQQAAIAETCSTPIRHVDRAAVLALRRRLGASRYRCKKALRRTNIQFQRQRQSLGPQVSEQFARICAEMEKDMADTWHINDAFVRKLQAS